MPISTVSGVLTRVGMGKLGRVGLEPAVRYERERPGELIHIDIKRLGRIERGAGSRFTGPAAHSLRPKHRDALGVRRQTTGWECVHIAVDDCTRLAYAEVLPDQGRRTVIGFLRRAVAFYARHGACAGHNWPTAARPPGGPTRAAALSTGERQRAPRPRDRQRSPHRDARRATATATPSPRSSPSRRSAQRTARARTSQLGATRRDRRPARRTDPHRAHHPSRRAHPQPVDLPGSFKSANSSQTHCPTRPRLCCCQEPISHPRDSPDRPLRDFR